MKNTSKKFFSRVILATVAVGFGAALADCSNDLGNKLQPLSTGSFALTPDMVSIVIHNYRPQSGNTFQNIFVSNYSVKVSAGKLYPSSSRDGLTDVVKTAAAASYGFTLGAAETVVTGFADLVLYDLGITSTQQSLMYCAGNQMLSTSNDMLVYNDDRAAGATQTLGLRDCEKVYLGLKPALFDNAGNGIPDYLKLRCGINPNDKNAAYISTAGDGVANIDKCKRNIPIDENAYTQPNQLYAYQYKTQLNSDGSTDLTISNIPILDGGNENFISLYVTETALTNSAPSVYTAYAILKSGYAGKKIETAYWATSPTTYFNQQISVP